VTRCNEQHRVPRPSERPQLAAKARERLEILRGRPFSDEEWLVARKSLREFVLVLRDWEAR
jgi:hypothetical protein